MTKITVSRPFCARRVITVGKDERSYHATQFGKDWAVYYTRSVCRQEIIGWTDKVRQIEFIVMNHQKTLA